ncbi:glycosyltransferase family 4 protein [Vibrio sp. TBV020]|uniref:glycosyltransferase family 4 protein n=1 Tax=Vibrio sp. TBV020 TaxID=3137398 RepID=UPI0038CDB5B5
MKICVIGTRGIPNVLGGVETHCQHLYPYLAKQHGHDVTIIARSPYVDYEQRIFEQVSLKTIWAPQKKSVEAILHSFLAAIKAKRLGADVVHVHAIGPGLLVPFCKFLGLKVVFTHHGPDYDRQKWGRSAKAVLKLGEKLACKFADEVIVISSVIGDLIKRKHGRQDTHLIHNGVESFDALSIDSTPHLDRHHLVSGQYIVAVGRFVEEKGFTDLIHAYKKSDKKVPLVLVGDCDHETEYSASLKQLSQETPGVVLTGFISGNELKAVFSNAKAFVMSSYHEGLPIALLEALSYSLDIVVSNIPANLEVNLPMDKYYAVGNIAELTNKINGLMLSEYQTQDYSDYLTKYDWEQIAVQTDQVYAQALGQDETLAART